jgi:hypothetical protein
MPSETKAILQIDGVGDIRVSEVVRFLAATENAYNGILVLLRTLEMFPRWERQFRSPEYPLMEFWPLAPMISTRSGKPRRLDNVRIASAVSRYEALVVKSVRLESPGAWKLVGISDCLEVIRKFINDRHERKKDKDYREARESERLKFENDILRTKAISDRVQLAKQVGIPEDSLAPLLNELLYDRLDELAPFQDRGVIDDAQLLGPDDEPNSENPNRQNPPALPLGGRKIRLED